MDPRVIPAWLAAALAFAVQAQTAPSPVPAGDAAGTGAAQTPSVSSRPSSPTAASTAGAGVSQPEPATAARRPNTGMLGAGAFGAPPAAGLENVLNTGSPPMYQRGAGPRKVCPPELENRNNVCVPPIGSILTR